MRLNNLSLDPLHLIPWSLVSFTPDLKAIIGLGHNGIFIYHWPYLGLAFDDRGIVVLENSVIWEGNLAPGLPVAERKEGS